MEVKIKRLSKDAIIPKKASNSAAGFDLYAINEEVIEGGETKIIHTGIAIEIPEGYFGAIYARSGLATREGLRPANCVGVIDSDYRGEIMIALHNDTSPAVKETIFNGDAIEDVFIAVNNDSSRHIETCERVAQLVIQKFEDVKFIECDDLTDTERGEGGFGSTGSN